jgi:hypothetical protein
MDKPAYVYYTISDQLAGGVSTVRKTSILLLALVALTISCSEKSGTPTQSANGVSAIAKSAHPTVSFAVNVHDSTGAPMPNLRVTVINDITIAYPNYQSYPPDMHADPWASIMFSLRFGKSGYWTAQVSDLNDSVCGQIDNTQIGLGGSADSYFDATDFPLGVYKVSVQMWDESAQVPRFRDSTYLAKWFHRPYSPASGFTSEAGRFETHDARLFPVLWDLPQLHSSYYYHPNDGFSFTNQILIDIIDTATGEWMRDTTILIRDSENELTVVWHPTEAPAFKRDVLSTSIASHPWRPVPIGDINCNGKSYEMADYVMYVNYFIRGLSAFGDHPAASIARSDVNGDGKVLTVADLDSLVLSIAGAKNTHTHRARSHRSRVPEAPVYPASLKFAESYDYRLQLVDDHGKPVQIGAIWLKIAGNVKPDVLASYMEWAYGFDGIFTNIVIYPSLQYNNPWQPIFSMPSDYFLVVRGSAIEAQASTPDGQLIPIFPTRTKDSLFEVYPNPF